MIALERHNIHTDRLLWLFIDAIHVYKHERVCRELNSISSRFNVLNIFHA
jgi:hypothetical protein